MKAVSVCRSSHERARCDGPPMQTLPRGSNVSKMQIVDGETPEPEDMQDVLKEESENRKERVRGVPHSVFRPWERERLAQREVGPGRDGGGCERGWCVCGRGFRLFFAHVAGGYGDFPCRLNARRKLIPRRYRRIARASCLPHAVAARRTPGVAIVSTWLPGRCAGGRPALARTCLASALMPPAKLASDMRLLCPTGGHSEGSERKCEHAQMGGLRCRAIRCATHPFRSVGLECVLVPCSEAALPPCMMRQVHAHSLSPATCHAAFVAGAKANAPERGP